MKVTFKPFEEVIIRLSVRYSLEDLVKLFSINVGPGGRTEPLLWAKGVAFSHEAMLPETSEVAKEQLEGKTHWLSVQWALMPEYKKEIDIEDINAKIPVADVSANSLFCAVADVSANSLFCAVAEALKEQSEVTIGQVKAKGRGGAT